jgi:hypothetical protein
MGNKSGAISFERRRGMATHEWPMPDEKAVTANFCPLRADR